MKDNINQKIAEALETQKHIFGDELFMGLNFSNSVKKPSEIKIGNTDLKEKTIKHPEKSKPLRLKVEPFQDAETISELEALIHTCQKCALGASRNKFVFGVGNANADIMVIGEAPGAEEDKQGIPFVGRAGKLLTDILKAIEINREEIYVANILKCRPPANRNPLPEEMQLCMPYLYKQIDLVKPKVILLLGLVAANGLLNLKTSLTKMRGNVYELNGVKTMVTYHPAALLRNPNWKRGTWEDVQQFKKLYIQLRSIK